MSTDLIRIGEKALKEPKLVFTSLYHHVTDEDNLRACYDELPNDKAVVSYQPNPVQNGQNCR